MHWPCRREEQKQELGHDPGVVVGDILKSQDLLKQELSQTDKLVILTSAVPKMKAPPADGKRPEFYFEEDGMPEQVGAGSLPSNSCLRMTSQMPAHCRRHQSPDCYPIPGMHASFTAACQGPCRACSAVCHTFSGCCCSLCSEVCQGLASQSTISQAEWQSCCRLTCWHTR